MQYVIVLAKAIFYFPRCPRTLITLIVQRLPWLYYGFSCYFFSLAETFAAIPSVFSYFYSVVYRADGIGTELAAGGNYSGNTSVLQKHIEEIHSGLIRTVKIPPIERGKKASCFFSFRFRRGKIPHPQI